MDNNIWKSFKNFPLPSVEEARKQAMLEGVLFPAIDEITQEWVKDSQIYHYLFGMILKERTGVERLEERILKCNISPALDKKENYYQKYDRLGLHYFYVRGTARVERLDKEDRELLHLFDETIDEDTFHQLLAMVENTFETIMAVSPENPTTVYEPKQTIHGDYQVVGKNIPLAMRSVATFTADGSLESEEAEQKRIQIFTNIWKQIDSALSTDLGCGTTTAIEVFEI